MSWRELLPTWLPLLIGRNFALPKPKQQPTTIPPRNAMRGRELTTQQSYLFGYQPAPYNPDDLVGKKGILIYRDMMRDEQVKAAMYITQYAALASGFDIVPAEMPEDADKARRDDADEHARFIKWNMDEMSGAYQSKLLEIMSAKQFGFSCSELLFSLIDYGEFEGKIKLENIKTRHPYGIDFETDEYGNLTSILQANKPITQLWKFMIYSYRGDFANRYGNSDLRQAFRPYWIKENALKFMTIALERHGTPMAKWSIDASTTLTQDQRAEMEAFIDTLSVRTGVIIPPGVKLEFDQASPRTNEVFVPVLRYLDERILVSQLIPGLIGMGGEQQTGSLARSGTEFETFLWVVQMLRQDLETLQDEGWIKPIIDLNYEVSDGLYPKFKFNELTDAKRKEIFELWLKGIQGEAITPRWEDENKARELIGYDPIEQKDWDASHNPANDKFGNPLPKPEPMPGAPGLNPGVPKPPVNGKQPGAGPNGNQPPIPPSNQPPNQAKQQSELMVPRAASREELEEKIKSYITENYDSIKGGMVGGWTDEQGDFRVTMISVDGQNKNPPTK